MPQLRPAPGAAFKSALVDVRLVCDFSIRWRKLLFAGARSNGKYEERAINHNFAAPAFFDLNTFNARMISGSMPFSISVLLLSSLMSTGTPLPS